jgi:predicted nuclease of predicted toxin-antitoxin system
MKLLVDAQLPRRMAGWLNDAGLDALHTLDLPSGNKTPDAEVIDFAEQEQRVVVTKDADFVNSHLLTGKPTKLLLIATGNISNRDLELLFLPLIPTIVTELKNNSFLELSQAGLTVRG